MFTYQRKRKICREEGKEKARDDRRGKKEKRHRRAKREVESGVRGTGRERE